MDGQQTSGNGTDAWATIDKTVRDVDEDKVKDCTDDIDTLLVFAGLYSAILTAFLIESYKALQEDPQDTMVQLLRNMSTQSYVVNGQFLNSTSSTCASQPFQAPTWAVRVNVCWFSSLVLSLSTASYGILVKQWLREYLAMDRTSHQERIRIRHYRHQGVEDWRLFDIAAVLPFIIQISLSLFFVGLCFFTASVHSSIGTTSVVLVSAWAAFIVFAILAPLFSPRCPFKTPLLKTIFSRIRPHLRSGFSTVAQFITSFRRRSRQAPMDALDPTPESPLEFPYYEDSALRTISHDLSRYVLKESKSTREEVDIRNNDGHDLIIFQTVDSIFLDDNLLGMMREALRRQPPSSYEVFCFVVSILQSRLGNPAQEVNEMSDTVPWPWALSYSARTSLINMVADSLLLDSSFIRLLPNWQLLESTGSSPVWLRDAVRLIFNLASPREPLPEAALTLFKLIVQDYRHGAFIFDTISDQLVADTSKSGIGSVVRILTCTTKALETADLLLAGIYLQNIALMWIYRNHDEQPPDPLDTFDRLLEYGRSQVENANVTARFDVEVIVVLVEAATNLLNGLVTAPRSRDEVFNDIVSKVLELILKAIPILQGRPGVDLTKPQMFGSIGVDKVLTSLLTTPSLIYPYLEFFSTRSDLIANKEIHFFLAHPGAQAQLVLSRDTAISILSNCTTYFETKSSAATSINLVTLLRLCRLTYDVPFPFDDRGVNEHWHTMFASIAACITKWYPPVAHHHTCQTADAETDSHTEVCRAAHAVLLQVEGNSGDGQPRLVFSNIAHSNESSEEDKAYSLWLKDFDMSLSQVPDVIIEVLRHFVCPLQTAERGCKFWRIRRLEDIESRSHSSTHHADGGVVAPTAGVAEGSYSDSVDSLPIASASVTAPREARGSTTDAVAAGSSGDSTPSLPSAPMTSAIALPSASAANPEADDRNRRETTLEQPAADVDIHDERATAAEQGVLQAAVTHLRPAIHPGRGPDDAVNEHLNARRDSVQSPSLIPHTDTPPGPSNTVIADVDAQRPPTRTPDRSGSEVVSTDTVIGTSQFRGGGMDDAKGVY
ncbi:hypothetical protein NM688_g2371 [Phlebia brevispora]|uniref:Uncharacterized protein n=1 Tax=Phlebia brevispora TaxID=194682 RepID=A0ACC1T8X0_9APHY|nr:hypothetical protein NM688_g2371 [Phlebia brevispora]